MAKKQDYVRIQLFPHSENLNGSGRSATPGSTNDRFYFKPIEINVRIGGLIKLGRRVERPRQKLGPLNFCILTTENRNGGTMTAPSVEASQASTPMNPHVGTGANTHEMHKNSGLENAGFSHFVHKNNNAVISKEEAEYRANDLIIAGARNQIKVGFEPKGLLGEIASQTLDYGVDCNAETRPEGQEVPADGQSSKDIFKIPVLFIAFRSKVVSRSHAEMWVGLNSRVYFRDNGSSSGTFLNQMRLSPSGERSRPHVINSGDIIQLGVDYQSNQREIFKCVVMKFIVSTNVLIRSKQNNERLNLAIKQLTTAMNPTLPRSPPDGNDITSDCCICLGRIVLMQALFLASCSHIFHYRCVVPLLKGGILFLCPLCRQATNLDSRCSDASSGAGSEDDESSESADRSSKESSPLKISTGLNSEVDDSALAAGVSKSENSFPNNAAPSKVLRPAAAPVVGSIASRSSDIPQPPPRLHAEQKSAERPQKLAAAQSTNVPSHTRTQQEAPEGRDDDGGSGAGSVCRVPSPQGSPPQNSANRHRPHAYPHELGPRLPHGSEFYIPPVGYFPYFPMFPQYPYSDPYYHYQPSTIPRPGYHHYLDSNIALDRTYRVPQSSIPSSLEDQTYSSQKDNDPVASGSLARDQRLPAIQKKKTTPHGKKQSKKLLVAPRNPRQSDLDAVATLKSRDLRIRSAVAPCYGAGVYGGLFSREGYSRNAFDLEEHAYSHPQHDLRSRYYPVLPPSLPYSVNKQDLDDESFSRENYREYSLSGHAPYGLMFYPRPTFSGGYLPCHEPPGPRASDLHSLHAATPWHLFDQFGSGSAHANHPDEDPAAFPPVDTLPVHPPNKVNDYQPRCPRYGYSSLREAYHPPPDMLLAERTQIITKGRGGSYNGNRRRSGSALSGSAHGLNLSKRAYGSDIDARGQKFGGAMSDACPFPKRPTPNTDIGMIELHNASDVSNQTSDSAADANEMGSEGSSITDTCSSNRSDLSPQEESAAPR